MPKIRYGRGSPTPFSVLSAQFRYFHITRSARLCVSVSLWGDGISDAIEDFVREAHTSEFPTVGCSRVDSYLIGQDKRFPVWGVAEYNAFAEVKRTTQEIAPDPQQVLITLVIERHARPYTGMHEESIF